MESAQRLRWYIACDRFYGGTIMAYLNLRERRIEATIAYLGAGTDGAPITDLLTRAMAHVAGGSAAISDTGDAVAVTWKPTHADRFRDCELVINVLAPRSHNAPLGHVDGVVLVVNAKASAEASNRASLAAVRDALVANERSTVPIVLSMRESQTEGALDSAEALSAIGATDLRCVVEGSTPAVALVSTLEAALEEVLMSLESSQTNSTARPGPHESTAGAQASTAAEEAHPLLTALKDVLRRAMLEHMEHLERRVTARLEAQMALTIGRLTNVEQSLAALHNEVRSEVVRLSDTRARTDGGHLNKPTTAGAAPTPPRLVVVNRSIEQRAIALEDSVREMRAAMGDSFVALEERLNLLDIRISQAAEQPTPKLA